MKKLISSLLVLISILSLSSCGASPKEIKKATDFMDGLASLEKAKPAEDLSKLVSISESVLKTRVNAFNLDDKWEKKTDEYEKYVYIFNSDATLSLYETNKFIDKVTYTFRTSTKNEIYDAAVKLTDLYGAPDTVKLDTVASTLSDVKNALVSDDKADFRYSFQWSPKINGQDLTVYLAYYYDNNVNFAYLVVNIPSTLVSPGK